jgi:hypothetical protein
MSYVHKCDLEHIYSWGDAESEGEKTKALARFKRVVMLRSMGVDVKDDDEWPRDVLLTQTQIADLTIAGMKMDVKQSIFVRDGADDILADAMVKFNTMAEKLMHMPSLERAENAKCHVHMPGQALATYNETMLLQDSCTDELQRHLDSGWRMIAACPQPDARRPDYILGRFNPEREATSAYATRGK